MKTFDNYYLKLSFIQKTMEFIFDNANDIDYDEENISFVVQELTLDFHTSNSSLEAEFSRISVI